MANIKLIKRRIKSVANIAQITKAMEMVAASKMKKAQEKAVLGKPYAQKIYEVITELASHMDKKAHPLLSSGNGQGKTLLILVSSNKGLCGGLNTSLFRMVLKTFSSDKKCEFITLGKKGEQFIIRLYHSLLADFSQDSTFVGYVPAVAKLIIERFITGVYKEVYLGFNTFQTALKQIPTVNKLLPLSVFKSDSESKNEKSHEFEFVMEPNGEEILEYLLPHYVENQIRAAILEAEASEHSARMIAMKNATDAANDFQNELTLLYNKARQEKITYEISDMVTARMAVE